MYALSLHDLNGIPVDDSAEIMCTGPILTRYKVVFD